MSTMVKNQHYVWRNYLKPWTTKGKLFCYRQKADKLFGTNVKGIASETFFYRVERLSQDDLRYLKSIIDRNVSEEIRSVHNDTIRLFQLPFMLRDQFEAASGGRKLSKELNRVLEEAEKTAGETYHTMTEQSAAPILEQLKAEDCSFFKVDKTALEFTHYLCHQFFRTPKIREISSKLINPFPDLSFSRTWFFESHIYADNVASGIYAKKADYRFCFLRNATSSPFLTSDQPVFNLNDPAKQPKLRLYYPLKPDLAVIFYEDSQCKFKTVSEMKLSEVEFYNQILFNRSLDQLYSNNKDYLAKFKLRDKSVGGPGANEA